MGTFLNSIVMAFGIMFIIIYSSYFGIEYIKRLDFIKSDISKVVIGILIGIISIPILTPILLAEKVLTLIDFKEMNAMAEQEIKKK